MATTLIANQTMNGTNCQLSCDPEEVLARKSARDVHVLVSAKEIIWNFKISIGREILLPSEEIN